jgi:hypothetical protein
MRFQSGDQLGIVSILDRRCLAAGSIGGEVGVAGERLD